MPSYLYEKIREDSDCVRIMREEDIDRPEGTAQIQRRVKIHFLAGRGDKGRQLPPGKGRSHTLCTMIGI